MDNAGIEQPVVTVSRLDNDDALSHDFLTTLARLSLSNAALRATSERIITFPHGVHPRQEDARHLPVQQQPLRQ